MSHYLRVQGGQQVKHAGHRGPLRGLIFHGVHKESLEEQRRLWGEVGEALVEAQLAGRLVLCVHRGKSRKFSVDAPRSS